MSQPNTINDEVWNRKSIEKTADIILNAKKKKTKLVQWLDKNLIWLIIILAAIGSLFAEIGFLPIMFLLKGILLYLSVGFIGLLLGIFFEFLVAELETVETHHHIAVMLIIPSTAVLNLFLIIKAAAKYGITLNINFVYAGLVYAASFLLPYISYEFFMKKRK